MSSTTLQLVPPFAAEAVHPEITYDVINRPRRRRRRRRITNFWKRVHLGCRVIDTIITGRTSL